MKVHAESAAAGLRLPRPPFPTLCILLYLQGVHTKLLPSALEKKGGLELTQHSISGGSVHYLAAKLLNQLTNDHQAVPFLRVPPWQQLSK